MHPSPFCHEGIPSQETLYESLNMLRRWVEQACLDGDVASELVEAVKVADRMVAGGNIPAAVDSIDRFILVAQRHLGSQISLSKAFELVDIAILDFKRFIADPAQVFTEAVAFSQRFSALNFAVDVPVTVAARPIPAGVPETVRAMREAIRSYRVPADAECRLLGFVDQMGELASQFDPAAKDGRLEAAFLAVVAPFKAELVLLQGRYITATQANRLFGIILFGVPAWLCVVPKAWIVQAILIAGGALIAYLSSDPDPVKKAATNLSTYISSVTAGATLRPTPASIQGKLRAETGVLSLEELRILKERLTTARDEAMGAPKGVLNVMLEELERVITERISGIEPVPAGGE
jgi:hypothetical protein